MRLARGLEVVLARHAKSCPVPSKPNRPPLPSLLPATVINKPPFHLSFPSSAYTLFDSDGGYRYVNAAAATKRKGRRGTFELIIWWCPVWIIQTLPPRWIREDRCALPVHRGVGPENGIAFLIYRGREIPLEISPRDSRSWETWILGGCGNFRHCGLRYVSSRRAFVRKSWCVDRASDGFCRELIVNSRRRGWKNESKKRAGVIDLLHESVPATNRACP